MPLNLKAVDDTDVAVEAWKREEDAMADAVSAALAKDIPTTATLIAGTRDALARNIEKLNGQKAALAKRIAGAKAETRQIDATIAALSGAHSMLCAEEA